jgi:periplasmic divalent cation tolerance protein
MKDIAIVYALFGDRAAAEIAAVQMVDRKLAACANILGNCLSVYHWNGELSRAEETPVLFKTMPDQRTALIAALVACHDYDVPAVSSWTAATTPDYGAWVETGTRI